jgi:hypothetical protein
MPMQLNVLYGEECKKIIEEVHNAPEKDNPIPGVCNYFKGYFSEEAKISRGKLVVIYKNRHGKVKRVSYGVI